jgi:hypothetical protein
MSHGFGFGFAMPGARFISPSSVFNACHIPEADITARRNARSSGRCANSRMSWRA